jgi:hypothetical protein
MNYELFMAAYANNHGSSGSREAVAISVSVPVDFAWKLP